VTGSDKFEHKTDELKGQVKEGAGDALDDKDLKHEGQEDQAKSQAKQAGDKVKDAADNLKDRVTGKD
jgi:uncharacterized protein YjbJ (UPF0337 family)